MKTQSNGGNKKESSLRRGPWTKEEDRKLLNYIRQHGHGSWRSVPAKAGLQRCGKSCRLRWTNYLRPGIKRGNFTAQEEKDILRLHALLGNRWSAIAAQLPRRTDNDVKNYWTMRLKKKLTRMGIDPVTHRPKHCAAVLGTVESKQIAELSHMAQWETTRLEAEARLVRESKLHLRRNVTRATSLTPPLKLHLAPRCLDVLKVWEATASENGFFSPTAITASLESPASTLSFPEVAAATNKVVFADGWGVEMRKDENPVVHDGSTAAGFSAGVFSELDPIGDVDDFMNSDYLQMLEENVDYWSSVVLGELWE